MKFRQEIILIDLYLVQLVNAGRRQYLVELWSCVVNVVDCHKKQAPIRFVLGLTISKYSLVMKDSIKSGE